MKGRSKINQATCHWNMPAERNLIFVASGHSINTTHNFRFKHVFSKIEGFEGNLITTFINDNINQSIIHTQSNN